MKTARKQYLLNQSVDFLHNSFYHFLSFCMPEATVLASFFNFIQLFNFSKSRLVH